MYAIKLISKRGTEAYLREGTGPNGRIAGFPTKRAADKQVEFMKIGMAGECQSINVVKYPRGGQQR